MFSNFKGIHLVYSILGLLIIIGQWVLAGNASNDFHLGAQIVAGIGTAITIIKTFQGLIQPSTSLSVNAKAAAVKVAGSILMVFARMALVVGFVMMIAGCKNGTIAPSTQADIQAAEQLGMCIESTYATDSQKVPAEQPLQIAEDIGVQCGADVLDVITTLGQGTASAARQAVAQAAKDNADAMHAASQKYKAAHAAPPGA